MNVKVAQEVELGSIKGSTIRIEIYIIYFYEPRRNNMEQV